MDDFYYGTQVPRRANRHPFSQILYYETSTTQVPTGYGYSRDIEWINPPRTCEYCGTITRDQDRAKCISCGAPYDS